MRKAVFLRGILYTDQNPGYTATAKMGYKHSFVNHRHGEYVKRDIHTKTPPAVGEGPTPLILLFFQLHSYLLWAKKSLQSKSAGEFYNVRQKATPCSET